MLPRGGAVRGRAKTRGTTRGASTAAAGSGTRGARPARGSSIAPARGTIASAPRGRGTIAPRGTISTSLRGSTRPPSSLSKTFNQPGPSKLKPIPADQGTFQERYEVLKKNRDIERAEAIANGFLADPDRPRTLAEAITPVGTCPDMCPEFERVERVVQNDTWAAEIDPDASGALGSTKKLPNEARMVKKFRRAAAGLDEQLPSDLRPPPVLKNTLDYLFHDLLTNSASLAQVHHFIWDRTRAVRNDFSIQQVSKGMDLQITIECYERIARFHTLSLHQLALAEKPYDKYDAQQEREQLDKTLLSLMQLYEDSRGRVPAPNEPEFRAYCIIFQIQNPIPDLEDRVQTWPRNIAKHPRVQRALRLYAAATNTADSQGPLKPRVSHPIAQQNWRKFWTLVKSTEISYLMACVAEIYFPLVRRTALNAIWNSCRVGASRKVEDWTLGELMDVFGFQTEHEVRNFCNDYGFNVATRADGAAYLDLTSHGPSKQLPDATAGSQSQRRSDIVEEKRHGRALAAVINGMSVQAAKQAGLVDESSQGDASMGDDSNEKSLFITDQSDEETPVAPKQPNPFQKPATNTPALNPFAPHFNPGGFGSAAQKPTTPAAPAFSFGNSSMTGFGLPAPTTTPQTTEPPKFGSFAGTPSNSAGSFSFGKPTQPTAPSIAITPQSLATPAFGLPQSAAATSAAPSTISKPLMGFSSTPLPPFTFGQSTSPAPAPTEEGVPAAPAPSSPFAPQAPKQQAFSGFSAPAAPAFNFAQPAKSPAPMTPTSQPPSTTTSTSLGYTAGENASQSSSAAGPSSILSGVPAAPPASVFNQPSSHASTFAPSQTARTNPTSAFNVSTPTPSTNSFQQQPQIIPPQSQVPARSSPQELERAVKAKAASHANKSALLDQVASALVTEKYGLLEQFIEYTVAPMITHAREQVLTERANKAADDFRLSTISQRFGRRWREIATKRRLARQGRERRRRLARDADARSQRSRESSIASQLEGFRDSIRSSQSSKAPSKLAELITGAQDEDRQPATNGLSDWASASQASNISFATPSRASTIQALSTITPFAPGATLRKSRRLRDSIAPSLSASISTNPSSAIPLDTTRSTYFRLKAMGLDPNSATLHAPTTSMTSTTTNDRKRARADSFGSSVSSGKRLFVPTASSLGSRASPIQEMEIAGKAAGAAQVPLAAADDDDELLAAARKVRQAMSETMSLFQEETAKEDLRKSQSPKTLATSRLSRSLAAALDLRASIVSIPPAPASERPSKFIEPPPKYRNRVSKFLPRERYADVQAQRRRTIGGTRLRSTTPSRFSAIENAVTQPVESVESMETDDKVSPPRPRAPQARVIQAPSRKEPFSPPKQPSPPFTDKPLPLPAVKPPPQRASPDVILLGGDDEGVAPPMTNGHVEPASKAEAEPVQPPITVPALTQAPPSQAASAQPPAIDPALSQNNTLADWAMSAMNNTFKLPPSPPSPRPGYHNKFPPVKQKSKSKSKSPVPLFRQIVDPPERMVLFPPLPDTASSTQVVKPEAITGITAPQASVSRAIPTEKHAASPKSSEGSPTCEIQPPPSPPQPHHGTAGPSQPEKPSPDFRIEQVLTRRATRQPLHVNKRPGNSGKKYQPKPPVQRRSLLPQAPPKPPVLRQSSAPMQAPRGNSFALLAGMGDGNDDDDDSDNSSSDEDEDHPMDEPGEEADEDGTVLDQRITTMQQQNKTIEETLGRLRSQSPSLQETLQRLRSQSPGHALDGANDGISPQKYQQEAEYMSPQSEVKFGNHDNHDENGNRYFDNDDAGFGQNGDGGHEQQGVNGDYEKYYSESEGDEDAEGEDAQEDEDDEGFDDEDEEGMEFHDESEDDQGGQPSGTSWQAANRKAGSSVEDAIEL